MTRVSENSQQASLKFALNKSKQRLENLQLKGSSLKSITKPSDNPLSNVEALSIDSRTTDNRQFIRNSDFALMSLNITDQSLTQLSEILGKAKEIAITQASDLYDGNIRKNVANEVYQLRNQALSVANKRVGQKYIFSGFKTLERPFDEDGNYQGDKGHISLEISKDFYVPINLSGEEVFFVLDDTSNREQRPVDEVIDSVRKSENPELDIKGEETQEVMTGRDLASTNPNATKFDERTNIFSLLGNLSNALENNDSQLIQNLLEKFDDATSRLITLRTRVGSLVNTIESSKNTIDAEQISGAERKSKLVDADVAELFSDITKQQATLKTTYQSSKGLLNTKLIDFLR